MTARDDFNSLAPEFALKVNGAPLRPEAMADLIALRVLDDLDAAGLFEVTLSAWDTAQMKPKWIDDAVFEPGNPMEIAFGYRDQTTKMMSGDITGLAADFPEGRAPTVTVRGHDRRHRLMRARSTRSYLQMKDSDIAAQIASAVHLNPDTTDTGTTLPYVLQSNQTDFEFLTLRARRIGYELTVRDDALRFGPRQTGGTPALTLHRDVELISFQPHLSTLGQVTDWQVRGWDPASKKEIVGKASVGDESKLLGEKGSGPAATKKAVSSLAAARVDSPVQSQQEADAMARGGFAEMAMRYVGADGVCIGDPRLCAGIVITLAGIGERFGGAWYVTSVEHSFAPRKGYRTRFSARRNAT